MAKPGMFFKASLRTKVLVPVLAVMGLLLAMTVLIVNQHFKQQVWTNSRQELDSTMLRFQHEQIKNQKSLKERFRSLTREPVYLAAFRTLDANTIRTQLAQMLENEQLADDGIVFIYFAPVAETATDNASPIIQPASQQINSLNITAGCYSVMQLARAGEPATDTVRTGDKLCSLVAIPILNTTHDQVIGTLAFGEEMGWNVAQELSIGSGGHSCTALLAGKRVIATTLPGTNLLDADLVALYHQLAVHAPETNAAPRSVVLKDKHYFFASGNFPSLKGDDSLGYLLFCSYEEQLASLQQTQWLLLVV